MKKLSFTLSFICYLVACSYYSQAVPPTNNPLAEYYGDDGYPAWSEEIRWNNVIDMSQYNNGANNFEKFENARDDLFAQGGGVLYYPAGVYHFDVPDGPNGRGLMLKEGVVIRGEVPPVSDRKAVTNMNPNQLMNHGLTSNPTKFVFTRLDFSDSLQNVNIFNGQPVTQAPAEHAGKIPKMWNMVGCIPANASKIGIAWVEIEFGFIWFGYDIDGTWQQWNTNYSYAGLAKGAWANRIADGTHPLDVLTGGYPHEGSGAVNAVMGAKRFVFGTHLKNSTIPNYAVNKSGIKSWKLEPGGWQFGPRMGVMGRHIFLANNCISRPTAWFMFDMKARKGNGWGGSTPFPSDSIVSQVYEYANCIGIEVNKGLIPYMKNRCVVTDSNGYYAPDIIIKENWIYNHGNKNYEMAGKWAVIKDNVAYKEPLNRTNVFGGPMLEAVVHKSSYKAHRGSNSEDYMNRAFDYGGWNVWFDNNRYTGTGSIGNDGEGILCQRHGGVEVFSIAMTRNEQGNTGQSGYLAPYDVTVIGLLHGWNKQRGYVGIAKPEQNWGEDICLVANTTPTGANSNISGQNGLVPNGRIQDFLVFSCPANSTPNAPVMTLTNISGAVEISWTNVEDEAGYAVQRRRVGTTEWKNIAFRPRQHTSGLVRFALGTTGNNIGTTANYGPPPLAQCWDSVKRDMNEPKWLDYTVLEGSYEYRVIALACDFNGDDGAISLVDTAVVTSIKGIASRPMQYIPVQVAPNPIHNGNITITYPAGTPTTIKLWDANGKLIQTLPANTTGRTELNTSRLNSGIYLIEAQTEKGATRTKLVVN